MKAIGGEACSLFVPDNPVMKFRRLTQHFIEWNVVNAGNAEARGNALPQQSSDYGLSASHVADLGRGMRSNGHAGAKVVNIRMRKRENDGDESIVSAVSG